MEPPQWVWIALAIPTIVSASVGVGIALVAIVRELLWRRGLPRARKGATEWVTVKRPVDPAAASRNGGAPQQRRSGSRPDG